MQPFYDRKLSKLSLVWLACVAALPSLLALAAFGIISKHDSLSYIFYADEIRTFSVPSGAALLSQSPVPISLFRIGGFPAFIAFLQIIIPQAWPIFLVVIQIIAQSGVAVLTYLTASKLGATPRLSIIAALLPAFGFMIAVNICILTDSLYSAAITTAAFILILNRSTRTALIAGLLIAAATSFREVTIFLVLAFIPLACLQQRKILCIILLILPTWGVAAAQIGWNISRGAGPTLTTSAQITMVQAVLPLLKNKEPVFDSDSVFDRTASATVGVDGYNQINEMQNQLFKSGFTAPEIAKAAGQAYFKTWERFPFKMLLNTISSYNDGFLAMPFEPFDVVAFIQTYNDQPRPTYTRLNILWHRFTQGDVIAICWLLAVTLSRLVGSAIAIYGLICPWFRTAGHDTGWSQRALWYLPIAFAGLYMPVHLEYRYLLPTIPVICVLAAVGWSRRHGIYQ
jgi:hypothetical protein